MIKLCLIHDYFSPLEGDLKVEKLMREKQDDVILNCDEPRHKMGGKLEQAAAEYLSSLLPFGNVVQWDKSTEGYHIKQNSARELPARIDELRFRVLLKKEE